MELILNSLDDIGEVAKSIVEEGKEYNIWVFDGQMGAGKTTLIKAICIEMGILDDTSSPTFSLVNVYETEEGGELYHFDFYRIKDAYEALDIGSDEYFYSGNFCFIEWAEKIPSLIPAKNLRISIKLGSNNSRTISLIKND